MLSLRPYTLITCPYEDCKRSGAVDVDFKRPPRRSATFACPSCKRRFVAFRDNQGDVVTEVYPTVRAKSHAGS